MTWRHAAASEAGSSHLATGQPCQDRFLAVLESDPRFPKAPVLTLFVADGSGSASHGGIGADEAVRAASRYINNCYLTNKQLELSENLAAGCVQAVRSHLLDVAADNGHQLRDYACTFLGVLASPMEILLMQIGDGGIVVDLGQGLEMPIKPVYFEYANMTNFITEAHAVDVLAVFKKVCSAEKIAVFTDGIQRIAVNMATGEPHNPFFAPFFDVLAKASEEEEPSLHEGLAMFLSSEAVNRRTDDDKTLVLAHRIP